jgi:hypothetical protein
LPRTNTKMVFYNGGLTFFSLGPPNPNVIT